MSSVTTEPEGRPSARTRIANWLNKTFSLSVSEDDPELIKKARAFETDAFGRRDPLVEHGIRQCQEEEQRAREQRHDHQQQEVAQRIEQRIEQQTVQSAQQQFEALDTWWNDKLTLAIGIGNDDDDDDDEEVPRHSSIAALFDAIGQIKAEMHKALRHQINTANTYAGELVQAFGQEMKGYLDEVRTVVWTHFETAERRHNDAMNQVTQQLADLEAKLSATHAVVDAFKELTDTLNQRIHELEVGYLDQHERDAGQIKTLTERLTAIEHDSGNLRRDLADGHERLGDLEDAFWSQRGTDQVQRERDAKTGAEQSKIFSDRLTAVEQQTGDLKRAAADDRKQLNKLDETYWSQRDSDQQQRDEQISSTNEKISGFAQQVGDFAHELKEVRRDLKRATDMTQEIHAMELRLDERRIAADKAKRGARGEVGPQGARGAKGDTGPAGKAGRDGHDGRDAPTIASWKTDARRYAVAPMLSNGDVGAVLPLRELFENGKPRERDDQKQGRPPRRADARRAVVAKDRR